MYLNRFFKYRFTRYPTAALIGLVTVGLVYNYYSVPQMNKELRVGELKDYLNLDLDADMMRKDLYERLGIKVGAKYFDIKEVEEHVNKSI